MIAGFDVVFSGYQPRLIAREDYIKFTRRESTTTYTIAGIQAEFRTRGLQNMEQQY
jgi:hypothetical protein